MSAILGWRTWKVVETCAPPIFEYNLNTGSKKPHGELFLASQVYNSLWRGPFIKAHSKPQMFIGGKHSPMGIGMSCGIHAHKTRFVHRPVAKMTNNAFELDSGNFVDEPLEKNIFTYRNVIGQIELGGKIVEHEYGYRAEKAIIRTLYMPPFIVVRSVIASDEKEFGKVPTIKELLPNYDVDEYRLPEFDYRFYQEGEGPATSYRSWDINFEELKTIFEARYGAEVKPITIHMEL